MLRLRRYRAFLIFAVITIGLLYHFTSLGAIESAGTAGVEGLKNLGGHKGDSSSTSWEPATKGDDTVENVTHAGKEIYDEIASAVSDKFAAGSSTPSSIVPDPVEEPEATPTLTLVAEEDEEGGSVPALDKPSSADDSVNVVPVAAQPVHESQDGLGRVEPLGDGSLSAIHWEKQTEHFPVPSGSIIQLPTGKPKAIPKIQYDFPDESATERVDREKKLEKIKEMFLFSWSGYRKNAWMHDELSPVSGNFRDPFCGWAATLVDSLDTLWMMDLKTEFEEATKAVADIDFTASIRNDIPLFETVIRYLGGLIAAYDLGGSKYRILLDKAVELAEVLIGAFDTPNRMPMTFYLWKPTFASQPHRANTRVVLAELGSLSVEFTRLAQITKEPKYYDAIARITIEFERWQNNTKIPGLWPQKVDASGCKKEEISYASPLEHSAQKGPGISQSLPQGGETIGQRSGIPSSPSNEDTAVNTEQTSVGEEATLQTGVAKRQLSDDISAVASPLSKPDCIPQGLASPPYSTMETFTLGGQADSVYEYLPKEYMLLGGLEPRYQNMYEMSVEATKKYLLFRPMIPDEKREILISGQVTTQGHLDDKDDTVLKAEGTHLTCFVGGMFGIGSKIFERKADLDLAKKLTDGCVWAYESTATGIMPEHFIALPCENPKNCPWNETAYWEALDPFRSIRMPSIPASQTVIEQASDNIARGEKAMSGDLNASKQDDEEIQASAVPEQIASNETTKPVQGNLAKRQLGDSESEVAADTASSVQDVGTRASPTPDPKVSHKSGFDDDPVNLSGGNVEDTLSSAAITPEVPESTQEVSTQEEYAKQRIRDERLPPGIVRVTGAKYILRPEAIESVFIMWRITGDVYWRKKGWKMFEAIQNATATEHGASAILDVTSKTPIALDEMESFWLAETLKYFYLLFSDPGWISLDDYVLNTEAHAFRRPTR